MTYMRTKIIRNESKKAGVPKYGNGGERSWLAIVCDGSPYKLFLSLVHVLYFCTSCKLPCGELKKHIEEVHGGKKDSIRREFDHVLPLCGPGHVEKNILSAAITVLWDLIGFEKGCAETFLTILIPVIICRSLRECSSITSASFPDFYSPPLCQQCRRKH